MSLTKTMTPLRDIRGGARIRLAVATAVALAVVPIISGSASGETSTFSNPTPILLPRGTPPPGCPNFETQSGCGDTAVPYPSTIAVLGMEGTITDVNVTLNELWHTEFGPNDLDIMLVSPAGTGVMLMSDACGIDAPSAAQDVVIQPDDAITLTFDDEAGEVLPADATQQQGCVSGTFRPVDDEDQNFGFLASDHFLPERNTQVAPVITNSESAVYATPDTTLLSTFDGQGPNGTWSLYAIDDWPTNPAATPAGAIEGGWSLEITTTGASPTTSTSTTTTSTTVAPTTTTTQAPPPGGVPTNKDQCKNGGWQSFGFKNQGQCVSFVNGRR